MGERNCVKIDQFNRIQGAELILGDKHYPVFKGINSVGRNKVATINIKHLNVSQNQATIVIVDEKQHFISDLNSSNGTFLHNSKLVPFKLYELTNEVDIKFGNVEARYIKVADHDTTMRLKESFIGMSETQNMTQNFYASNTQLINVSTINQTDEHNYSNTAQTGSNQEIISSNIHEMATQIEEYPQQYSAAEPFPKPTVKPVVKSIKENISDIHNAPTQEVILSDYSSNTPKLSSQNIPENIEEDMEATHVVDYSDKYDVPISSGRIDLPIQNEMNSAEGNRSDKGSNSSEASSAETLIINSAETTRIVDQINTKLHDKQRSTIHNSQEPSTSGLNILESCEPEESFNNATKSIEPEGIIDDTFVQPDDENSNDSIDFFTMQNIDNGYNNSIKVSEEIFQNVETLEKSPNETGNSHPDQTKQNSMNENNITGLNMQNASKVLTFESGSETEIDSDEDIPKEEEIKNLNTINDNIQSDDSKKTESDDIDNTQDIGFSKKPLRKLDSDDTGSGEDTDINNELLDADDESDSTQDISIKKKPLKKLEDSEDDNVDSTQETCTKKKLSRKLDSEDSDNVKQRKKRKCDFESVSTSDKVAENYVLESKCEDEIVKEITASSHNKVSGSDIDKVKLDVLDTKIDDNDQPNNDNNEQNDSSGLEKSLNDTDCIPATQDAFAEAFSYRSSKTQTSQIHSSEEESFKLGITQLMEDGSENKSEEFRENKKYLNDVSIVTEDNKQLNRVIIQQNEESEGADNGGIFLEATQQINVTAEVHSIKHTTENPNSSNNDDVYFMPTQRINSEQDANFKVPTKKFTFKKKSANLEESLTTILSNNTEDDVYLVATQQINLSVPQKENESNSFEQPTQKLNVENDDDIFQQATQFIDMESKENPEGSKDDDVYMLPTQQMSIEKDNSKPDGDDNNEQEDAYRLETQILPERDNKDSNKTKDLPLNSFHGQKEDVLIDPPLILNDTSIIPSYHDTESEMPFTDENLQIIPSSNSLRPENPLIHALNEKSNNEEESELKTNVTVPSKSKITKKCDIKSLQDKIAADLKNDDAETLSHIEAFVKNPIENVSRNPDRLLRKEEVQNSSQLTTEKMPQKPKRVIENNEVETLSQIEAFIKKPLDMSASKVRKSVRRNQTLPEQEMIHINDVNQSVALIETKTSKVKRQPKRDIVDEIKVTVTSHRRSMGVAEISKKEPRPIRKSRKVTVNNNFELQHSTGAKEKPEILKEKEPEIPAKISHSDSIQKESIVRKSARTSKNHGSCNITSEEPLASSTLDIDNKKNKADNTNGLTVSSINIQKRRTSRLKSTKISDNLSDSGEEFESALRNTKDVNVRVEPSTPSKAKTHSNSKTEPDASGSTPKRKRLILDETLCSSAERLRRKQRPKVVFTMMDNPQLELYIKHLGGSVVDTVDASTVLVTGEVKRSQKLLEAVGQGKPICSPSWIQSSRKSNEFLDPWDFILTDKESESRWNFSLRESLNRATCKKLLSNYAFQLMVSKAADVLKGAIEASGGKCVTRNPGKNYEGHFVVVASPEHKAKYTKLRKQNPNITIVEPEAIFDGVLRQELRFTKHLIT